MPEATPVVPNAANPAAAQTTAGNSPKAPEINEPHKSVTMEEVQALLNPIAAQLRRMQQSADKADKGEKPNTEADKSYAERLKVIEAESMRAKRRLRESAISDAAREAGVDPNRTKAFKTLLEAEYGSKLKLNDDDTVSYVDEFEREVPLSDLVSQFLKKPEGEMFRAPKQVASSKGLRGQSGQIPGVRPAFHELPKAERDKMTDIEKMAYVKQDMSRND